MMRDEIALRVEELVMLCGWWFGKERAWAWGHDNSMEKIEAERCAMR